MIRDKIPHYINVLKIKFLFFIGNINKLNALWWNVKLGKKNRFDGITYFNKLPNTEILIGNNCEFRSRKNSNLIGINRPCSISTLKENAKIEIGNDCGFSGSIIAAFKSIKIGNSVRCGANTLISDSDWHEDDYRSGVIKEIIISDNVWLGVNVVILKGVFIGENSVIGANSVVTDNIPANVIAAGIPCKVIKQIQK